MNNLEHVAIIMDGNRRWSKKQGLLQAKGYEKGTDAIEEAINFCVDKNIKILTVYAFSMENWNRPIQEVKILLGLLDRFLTTKANKFTENNIRFRAIGDIEKFDNKLKEKIYALEENTKLNEKLVFNLAISYGSKNEIIRAFDKLTKLNMEINERNITSCLDVSQDVDLLIRTGGECRISNFLLWQLNYAELAFTQTLWPDFTYDEFAKIVQEYENKNRTFGR